MQSTHTHTHTNTHTHTHTEGIACLAAKYILAWEGKGRKEGRGINSPVGQFVLDMLYVFLAFFACSHNWLRDSLPAIIVLAHLQQMDFCKLELALRRLH